MNSHIEICTMQPEHIPFGMTLKDLAGWNQLPLDWERFQEFEPEGCFVARCDGRLAGTVTTITYEKLFGWVGMVLVHPDMRRRGLGTSLLMAGIDYLENKGVAAVKLDATPMGKQLYDTIGFVDEYMLERWQGRGQAVPPASGPSALTPADLPALCGFDLPIFGADRSRVLSRLVHEPTIAAVASFADGQMQGYAAVRPGSSALYLGPWVATDPTTAECLWTWALALAGDMPLFVDVLLPNPHVLDLVRGAGFEKQRRLIRMYRGTNVSPGRPELQYGILGPETG